MTPCRFAAVVLALSAGAGCSVGDRYEGTWERGNERVRSRIEISRHGEEYRFLWDLTSADDSWSVRCGRDAVCEGIVDGVATMEYRFDTWVDAESGRLMVECTGTPLDADGARLHYVDQLVVEPDGRSLWSYTVKRNGQVFEGDSRPKRMFIKVGD